MLLSHLYWHCLKCLSDIYYETNCVHHEPPVATFGGVGFDTRIKNYVWKHDIHPVKC